MQHDHGDDDVRVREVEDARGAQRVRKLPSARWVAGLTPEEPQPLAASAPPEQHGFPKQTWLQTSVWWLTFSAAHAFLPGDINNPDLVFPLTDAGSVAALDRVSTPAIIAMAIVHIFIATGFTLLALKLGRATQSFANFLAFGVGVLTIIAAIGEAVLLEGACTWFRRSDCFLPFVMHWLVSCCVRFGPALANALNFLGLAAAPAVCKHVGLPGVVMVAIAFAPLAYLLCGLVSAWWAGTQEPLTAVAPAAFQLASGSMLFFAWIVNRIPPFKATEAKLHAD